MNYKNKESKSFLIDTSISNPSINLNLFQNNAKYMAIKGIYIFSETTSFFKLNFLGDDLYLYFSNDPTAVVPQAPSFIYLDYLYNKQIIRSNYPILLYDLAGNLLNNAIVLLQIDFYYE